MKKENKNNLDSYEFDSNKLDSNKLFLNLKYGWEFLRRREKYRKDYFASVPSLKKELSKKDYELAKSLDFNDAIIFKVGQTTKDSFKKKYYLGVPLNPDVKFEYLGLGKLSDCEANQHDFKFFILARLFKDFAFRQTGFGFEEKVHPYAVRLLTEKPWNDDFIFVDEKDNKRFLRHDGQSLEGKDVPNKITLEVDLRYSLEIIKPALDALVSEFKEVRRHIGVDKYDQRKRYDKYDNYLQIYQLAKEHKTLRQIAKIVYKDEYDKMAEHSSNKYDILPLTEKVKNNLKACQKIINDGFKIIG